MNNCFNPIKKILFMLFLFFAPISVICQTIPDSTMIKLKSVNSILNGTLVIDTLKENSFVTYFQKCYEIKNSDFSGTDTIIFFDGLISGETIKVIRFYEKGRKVLAKGFYDNDSLFIVANFNGFALNGWFKQWHKNGNVLSIDYYENGIPQMPNLGFNENGILTFYGEYFSGKSTNWKFSRTWNDEGKLIFESKIIDDSLFTEENKAFYVNGNLHYLEIWKQDTIRFNYFYENGQLAYKGQITAFLLPFGKIEQWYVNGNKKMEGYFKTDKFTSKCLQDGIWKYWDEHNRIIKILKFANGLLIYEEPKSKINLDTFDNCILPGSCY